MLRCSSCHLSPAQTQKVCGRTAFTSNQKFWMHNLLIFLPLLPIRLKQSTHSRFLTVSSYFRYSWSFYTICHFLALLFLGSSSLICLSDFISQLPGTPTWDVLPTTFPFYTSYFPGFFLIACHAFQKSAVTSKDNSPWSSSGSGAGGQKTSTADCAQ